MVYYSLGYLFNSYTSIILFFQENITMASMCVQGRDKCASFTLNSHSNLRLRSFNSVGKLGRYQIFSAQPYSEHMSTVIVIRLVCGYYY